MAAKPPKGPGERAVRRAAGPTLLSPPTRPHTIPFRGFPGSPETLPGGPASFPLAGTVPSTPMAQGGPGEAAAGASGAAGHRPYSGRAGETWRSGVAAAAVRLRSAQRLGAAPAPATARTGSHAHSEASKSGLTGFVSGGGGGSAASGASGASGTGSSVPGTRQLRRPSANGDTEGAGPGRRGGVFSPMRLPSGGGDEAGSVHGGVCGCVGRLAPWVESHEGARVVAPELVEDVPYFHSPLSRCRRRHCPTRSALVRDGGGRESPQSPVTRGSVGSPSVRSPVHVDLEGGELAEAGRKWSGSAASILSASDSLLLERANGRLSLLDSDAPEMRLVSKQSLRGTLWLLHADTRRALMAVCVVVGLIACLAAPQPARVGMFVTFAAQILLVGTVVMLEWPTVESATLLRLSGLQLALAGCAACCCLLVGVMPQYHADACSECGSWQPGAVIGPLLVLMVFTVLHHPGSALNWIVSATALFVANIAGPCESECSRNAAFYSMAMGLVAGAVVYWSEGNAELLASRWMECHIVGRQVASNMSQDVWNSSRLLAQRELMDYVQHEAKNAVQAIIGNITDLQTVANEEEDGTASAKLQATQDAAMRLTQVLDGLVVSINGQGSVSYGSSEPARALSESHSSAKAKQVSDESHAEGDDADNKDDVVATGALSRARPNLTGTRSYPPQSSSKPLTPKLAELPDDISMHVFRRRYSTTRPIPNLRKVQSEELDREANPRHNRHPSGRARRVLIAEDSKVVRLVLARMLESSGFEVHAVEDGDQVADAMDAWAGRGAPFDVVILDIRMERTNGSEICRELVAAGATMPIIACTANCGEHDVTRYLLEDGFAAVVEKPASAALLCQAIDHGLRSHGSPGGLAAAAVADASLAE